MRGLAGGRPCAGAALPDVADRACADRDQRLDRGARHQRPLYRLHLDAGAVLLARHLRQDPGCAVQHLPLHRRHRRRRLWRQGGYAHRAALHPRRHADRTPGALFVRARGGDAVRSAARRRAHLHQGWRDARRPRRRTQDPRLFRQRRLYAAVELCRRQMRRASAGPLHDSERLWRRLLRLHQPHAGDRHARLRRHRDGFCDRVPDGQARASRRHGPDGVPHPQCLSRRRHEGAPARGQEHRADRMRPGRRGKGQMAAPRGVQARLVAQGWRRRAAPPCRRRRASPRHAAGAASPAAHDLRSRAGSRA